MCGIYCSIDISTFEVLDEVNQKRGNFATGALIIHNDIKTFNTIQREGKIDWNEVKLPIGKNITYLGHNQAPTGSARKWRASTSHPFQYGDWIVAHNGVLTNFKELKEDYIPDHHNPVDSSVIPALLNELEYKKFGPCENEEDEVCNLLFVLERLKGTYALWIYNSRSGNIYIARQGSTLFYKGTSVSSIKGKYYKEVAEGILYKYNDKGLKPIEGFITESPFLTL